MVAEQEKPASEVVELPLTDESEATMETTPKQSAAVSLNDAPVSTPAPTRRHSLKRKVPHDGFDEPEKVCQVLDQITMPGFNCITGGTWLSSCSSTFYLPQSMDIHVLHRTLQISIRTREAGPPLLIQRFEFVFAPF